MADADTIVLVHGLWMNPVSWQGWIGRFTERGFTVLAPAWPGMEGDVEPVRRDTSGYAKLHVREIIDHYEAIIRGLPRPPIVMGHSFGGAFVQLLLDRGLGAAGVAVHSAPTRGVLRVPLSTIRSTLPIVRNPFNRNKAVEMTPQQFRYAFGNTLSEEKSLDVYLELSVPGVANILFAGALANVNPWSAFRVDYQRADRAPLLCIAGGTDHVVPASVNRANVEKYRKSPAVVRYHEFPGRSHYTVGEDGWEQVADFALEWAVENQR
ncbi:MAG TPA: alpha/beta hydrolase [Acidimicrobiales bacterium]|nr:alpha/beta hydrolase [Acidimicrobiales bacterium]